MHRSSGSARSTEEFNRKKPRVYREHGNRHEGCISRYSRSRCWREGSPDRRALADKPRRVVVIHVPSRAKQTSKQIPSEGPYTGRCSRQDLHSVKRIFSQKSQRSAADAAAPCIFFAPSVRMLSTVSPHFCVTQNDLQSDGHPGKCRIPDRR